jgi:hypothetical protein
MLRYPEIVPLARFSASDDPRLIGRKVASEQYAEFYAPEGYQSSSCPNESSSRRPDTFPAPPRMIGTDEANGFGGCDGSGARFFLRILLGVGHRRRPGTDL